MKKFILFLVFALSMFTVTSFAQNTKYSKVKINLDSKPNELTRLAALGVGIDHGLYREGVSFTSDFSADEIAIMKNNNFNYEVLVDDVASDFKKRNRLAQSRGVNLNTTGCNSKMGKVQNPVNFNLGSMGGYYTFNEMKADLDKMAQLYPNLISVKQSLATTIDGNPIYYVRISDNPSVNETEPEVLYTALHHSREPASISQLMYFMWYMLENYSKDATIKHIVDNTELYLVPCVNPDGYKYNESTNPSGGGMWRKNRKKLGSTYGVDLNRNYGKDWGYDEQGSSGSTVSEAYRGPSAFSEIETSTMKSFCESHNFLLALNYHTFGNLLIYPWGAEENKFTPDSTLYDNFAQKLTAENHYLYGLGNKTVGYVVNGNSDDWMYGEQGTKNKIISMTPESGAFNDGFWPTSNKIIPICRENLLQNIEAALFAGQYATAEDISPKITSSTSLYAKYNVKRFGMANDGNFTVTLAPVSNVSSVGISKSYNGLSILETKLDSIALTLSSAIKAGQTFAYSIAISNGSYSIVDTITKIYGTPVQAFSDDMTSLAKWNASGFQLYNGSYNSTPSCVTDSPSGKYTANANATLTLKSAVNLSGITHAALKFKAKWDIESGMDLFKVQISTNNGSSWQSLCGKYSKVGTATQGSDIIFDGVKSSWVQEDISLDSYIGSNVLIRFNLISDDVLNRDGLYLDDIAIETVSQSAEKSSAKEMTSFQFNSQNATAIILGNAITITVPNATNITNLVATFGLSAGATASIQGVNQISGSTINDFSTSKIYTITAEDGSTKNFLVTVKLAPPVSPTVTVSNKTCEGATISNLTATGTSIKWYSDAGLTNVVGTGNSFATGQTKAGSYIYYVTQTLNNIESAAITDTLTIISLPSAPVSGGEQSAYVGGAIPNLSASADQGSTITWYSDLALTQSVATGSTYTIPVTNSGTYTYYASASISGCKGTSTAIKITLNNAPSTWTSITPVQSTNLYGVSATTSTNAIAVGASGVMDQYKGTSWIATTSGLGTDINSVHFLNSKTAWAVGKSGKVLKYNGSTWTAANSTSASAVLSSAALNTVFVIDSTTIWAAGAAGKLIKNNGTYWSTVSTNIYGDIKGLSFANKSKGVYVATSGYIYMYDGTTWTEQKDLSVLNDFNGVFMLDPTNAWAVGTSGIIVKYNGTKWSTMTSGVTTTLRSVYFTSATDGWAVGDGGVLLHCDGISWTKVASGTTNALNSIAFSDANHGFAVGAAGTILQYTNKVSNVVPPSVSPIVICKGETVPAFTTSGTSVKWYSDVTLKTVLGTGNAFTSTESNVGTYTYYVSDTQNNNESVATAVTLTIRDLPVAPTSSGNQTISQGSVLAPLSVLGSRIFWYSTANLSSVLATGNSYSPSSLVLGTTTYYATQTVLGCKSLATSITLTVNPVVKSAAKEISAFSFVSPAMTGVINDTLISITVPFGTNVSALTANFTASSLSTVSVQSLVQTSGISQNNYTNPLIYTVTAEDGSKKQYKVTVTISSSTPSDQKDILSFGFSNPSVTATINGTNITAIVPNATNRASLKANFSLSSLATVTVNSVAQTSGVTSVDFTNPVIYVVKAENNTTKNYTVTISLQAPDAPVCSSPLVVCEGGVIPSLSATGSNISWYADSTLQNLVFSGSTLATGKTTEGVYTYYATQTSNGISSLATKVVLTILTSPLAPISTGNQTAYEGGYIPNLNVNAANGTTITWYSDQALTQQVGTGTSLNTGKTDIGTYSFYATASTNSCKSTATMVQLSILNGATWSVMTSLQSNILFGVSANSSNAVLAVGATGVVDQYNGTWKVGDSKLSPLSDINAVHFVSPKTAWAVGKSGKKLKFDGTSWSVMSNTSGTTLYAVYALDSATIYAGGASGGLYKSTSNGTSWTFINTGNTDNIRGISFANASKGVLVGVAGSIIVYNGSTWTLQTAAKFTNDFYGVHMLDVNTAWAVGSAGTIVKYNGTTWSPVTSGTTAILRSVYFTSATNGWAVGDGGVILHYDGTSWTTVASGTTNNLNSVSFSDANNGWAVGAAGTILNFKNLASKITPPSVTPTTACKGGIIPAFSTTGANIKWYSDAQLKTKVGAGLNYTPSVTNAGTYTYYVTDSLSGSTTIASSVTLTINDTPSAPISGGNASMNEGATVNPLTATGTSLVWYSDVQVSAQVGIGNSYTPASPSNGLNTYYVTQTVNGCKSPATSVTLTVIPKSDAKEITSFSFNGLSPVVVATINGTNITATVPFGTDVSNLAATFTASNLTTVKVGNALQVSTTSINDFSAPVTYVVTAENGSTKTFTVTVSFSTPSIEKEMFAFTFASINTAGVISGTNITVDVPFGTNIANLIATFSTSPLSKVNIVGTPQVSNLTANNFVSPVIYSVVAQDGSSKNYTVTVNIAAPSTAKDITEYSFASLSMNGTIQDTNITFTVPSGTNVSNLVASFTASDLATVTVGATNQVSATTLNDFTNTVKYVVTAQDGSKKNYYVTVNVIPASTAKEITAFSVNLPNIVCTIKDTLITATVPYGTAVDKVIATFTNSAFSTVKVGVTNQVSATTLNDFSNPVVYVVTAQDGSTKSYKVTIAVTPASPAKELVAFGLVTPATVGLINGTTITLTVPYGTDVTKLVPTFTASNFASVKVGNNVQSNGVTQHDFTAPVTYIVTAQDGSIQNYTVIVSVSPRIKSSAKELIAFSISSPNTACVINGTTVTATVPYSTNVTNLVATFIVSDSAKVTVNSVKQVSGTSTQDFTGAVVYTVTAEDGSTKSYIVTISIAAKVLSSAKEITSFSIKNPAVNCIVNGTDIKGTLPFGTDLTKLVAIYNASALSTVTVKSVVQSNGTTVNDYSQVLTYTVTAEDGSYQNYDVTLTIESKSKAKEITDFSIVSPTITATIDQNNITATVPYGTDLTKLVVNFTASNLATVMVKGVTQISGQTVNDFTNSVTYVVTAEDGSTQNYVVIVTIAPDTRSNEKELVSFGFVSPAVTALINGTTITATLPYGTDLNNLLVNFVASDKSTVSINGIPQISGTTKNNFSSVVIYKVTAENGTTKEFTVIVGLAKNSAKEITSFLFTNPAASATFNGTTISLQVPFGTDVKKLIASFTVSAGANVKVGTINQQSGVTLNDFTNPVSYTVTAEDGTSQVYTVVVYLLAAPKSSEKDMLTFGITNPYTIGVISGTNIALTVPYGTDVKSLTAFFTLSPKAIAYINGIGQITGASIINFSAPVTYTVTAEDGTTKTYSVTVTIDKNPLGIDEVTASTVSVYPNPTNGTFFVNATSGSLTISVTDLQGREVYRTLNNSFTGEKMAVSLADFGKATYLVNVTNNGVSSTHKLEVIE